MVMKKGNTDCIGLGNWKVPGVRSEFLHYIFISLFGFELSFFA